MTSTTKKMRYVGLDVHAETIAVAVADAGPDGNEEVRSLGIIPNRAVSVAKLMRKLMDSLVRPEQLMVCYEAGPTGFVLYWEITQLGIHCDVVAPGLVPTKPSERVKTDRRDAMKLARSYRSGDLTPIWVPDEESEALRSLVRCREAAKEDQLRARNRLGKFLLKQGVRRPDGMTAWRHRHREWLGKVRFDEGAREATFLDYLHEVDHATERVKRLEGAIDEAVANSSERVKALVAGLQVLRGVKQVTAVTVVSEVGTFRRFAGARNFMGYTGAVSSEHSSGERKRRGGITKSGNAHLRRVLVESAHAYRHRPSCTGNLKKRQEGQSEDVKAIAWKAQHRLSKRYSRLKARGKPMPQVVTAVARELSGFVWAIGMEIERKFEHEFDDSFAHGVEHGIDHPARAEMIVVG